MECEGCKGYPFCDFLTCGYVAINECPCRTCLIKSMCTTPCELMDYHYKETYKMSGEKKDE